MVGRSNFSCWQARMFPCLMLRYSHEAFSNCFNIDALTFSILSNESSNIPDSMMVQNIWIKNWMITLVIKRAFLWQEFVKNISLTMHHIILWHSFIFIFLCKFFCRAHFVSQKRGSLQCRLLKKRMSLSLSPPMWYCQRRWSSPGCLPLQGLPGSPLSSRRTRHVQMGCPAWIGRWLFLQGCYKLWSTNRLVWRSPIEPVQLW